MASRSKNANNPFRVLGPLYQRASEILIEAAAPAELLIQSQAIHRLPDRKEADQLLAVLNKDITYYSEKLNALRKKHVNFPAKPKSPDDPRIFEAWVIGNEYIELTDRMYATLLPISAQINELIESAASIKGETNE